MNGLEKRSREEALGRHVGGVESARPRKVAPWPWNATSWTPWNWSEARKQFETTRKVKSQIP